MSAPHEQYSAPKASEQTGEWMLPQPGAVSTENAAAGAESRQSACSASISLGQRLNPVRCRVSVVMLYGPAVCCWIDPAPASIHRLTAPSRISFASASWSAVGTGSMDARQGATRDAVAFAPAGRTPG
jgi:hypothetical protein